MITQVSTWSRPVFLGLVSRRHQTSPDSRDPNMLRYGVSAPPPRREHGSNIAPRVQLVNKLMLSLGYNEYGEAILAYLCMCTTHCFSRNKSTKEVIGDTL